MTRARPLAGVQVLDLSRVLSGPSCGKALVDLGASVMKVEPPEGDLTSTARPRVGGIPVYFAQQNCGKQWISVELGTEAGRELVAGLAAKVDVVLENFGRECSSASVSATGPCVGAIRQSCTARSLATGKRVSWPDAGRMPP